jgi:hypothetical protein
MNKNRFYNEMITQVAFCSHPNPEKVLVVGEDKDFKLLHVGDATADRLISVKILDYSIDENGNLKLGFKLENRDGANHNVKVDLMSDSGIQDSFYLSLDANKELLVEKRSVLQLLEEINFC